LAILFLVLFSGVLSAPPGSADQGEQQLVHRYELTTGPSALIDSEGGLTIMPADFPSALLRAELLSAADSRRRRPFDVFHAVAGEGIRGGHRGFSSQADDDGDGQVDEDPLDGIDNDLDGRIDEDFAAISDAMVSIHLGGGGSGRHGTRIEFYHWAGPGLGATVFLSAGGGADAGRAIYRLQAGGSAWKETRITSLLHSVVGQPLKNELVALVSRVVPGGEDPEEDPCSTGKGLWLGVMILDGDSPTRFLLDNDRLDLPLGADAVPLAVCTAESWLQLSRALGEARRLYRGLTDPVDQRQARWILPPACSTCRSSGPPDFDLRTDAEGRVTLSAMVGAGQSGLLDPDLFRVEGALLGAPRQIRWLPAEGQGATIAWNCQTPGLLQEGGRKKIGSFMKLAGSLDHRVPGRLEFIFEPQRALPAGGTDGAAPPPVEITGRFLDGRPFRDFLKAAAPVEPEAAAGPGTFPATEPETVEQAARRIAEERARLLSSRPDEMSLSADLLKGWPNPFSDVINIRFTVPRTLKEAFVCKTGEGQPAPIDIEGEVPWSGGQAGVSVKIYSLNGQELVTLNSASLGPGEYNVQWSGTDAFGRKAASGTYFCKLQMDDWSVTRRLVFIR
jgi:hypothetical protein